MYSSKKALLVIDMQKDLCYDTKRKDKVMKMLTPLSCLINTFYSFGFPVFYICFALEENDDQFKRFGDRYCIKGTEGAEVIDELIPLRGEIIYKRKHSAFFETTLNEKLLEEGIKEIYLTGMQTQICIMTTAADANFRGYEPIVVKECVLSTREGKKIQALKWIEDYVGKVQNLKDVLDKMNNE